MDSYFQDMGLASAGAAAAVAVATAIILASYRVYNFDHEEEDRTGQVLFTAVELAQQTGKRKLLLAILGDVFDVSTGAKHYARGSAYGHFVGRDASRAFATGDYGES